MPGIDRGAPVRFLQAAYQPEDWVAVFLKSYDTGRVAQRVGPLSLVSSARFQAWLRAMNARRFNVYVGVNAIAPGRRSRTKEAISAVRHVFLEADHDGQEVLTKIAARRDLPQPSYVLHSSPNRVHVLWRAAGFTIEQIERLQKHLAHQLDTDLAATPASQLTRLPGLLNHKYVPPHPVRIDYVDTGRLWTPADFPEPSASVRWSLPPRQRTMRHGSNLERAQRYLETIPPAIAGEHGDLHTFRVCCRLVRGFALDDDEALTLLASWNVRCVPPWSERDLHDKILRARRYGREPIGGLLGALMMEG
jgi:RepB DNA-primase from phage plasmid